MSRLRNPAYHHRLKKEKKHGHDCADYERAIDALLKNGVTSWNDVATAFPRLSRKTRLWSVFLLSSQPARVAVPQLLDIMRRCPAVRVEAAHQLSHFKPRWSRSALARMVQHISGDDNLREAAVFGLAWLFDDLCAPLLTALLANRSESIRIRREAAEGLANCLNHCDRRQRVAREAAKVLLACLDDPSPVVRFWSIFALGNMRWTPALSQLRRISRNDRAVCPGWWRVGAEATDAIFAIRNDAWPETDRPRLQVNRRRSSKLIN